jgi:GNAT superfamily N-acetyltransferase
VTELPVFRFESKSLRRITRAEAQRLRVLTAGGEDSHLLTVLRKRPHNVQCFLAWDGQEIVGWSLARWFAPFADSPRNAHVSVFVDPAWRGHGLGRDLVGQAVEFAAAHRLRPWVYAGTADQLAFTRACGHPVGVVTTPFPLR